MRFENRRQAGGILAQELAGSRDLRAAVALGLPRGGVPVAYETAKALHIPLDVFVVRKLGVPGHEELAMGAIATGGVRALNEDIIGGLRISPETVARVAAQEQQELERREHLYRKGRPTLDVKGRTAILIDDGLATGASMRAAVLALRALGPARIVVAAPTGSADACRLLESVADEVVCVTTPEPFYGVGAWYEDFTQTSDDEVRELLERAAAFAADRTPAGQA